MPKKDVLFWVWLLYLNIIFVHSFVVSDWSEAMLKHPEWVRLPLFLKDLCVDWGACSKFKQVSGLPCLLVCCVLRECAVLLSVQDTRTVWSPLGMWEEGARVVCRVQASLWVSYFRISCGFSGFVPGLLPGPTDQPCYWWCCWTAYFHLGLKIIWSFPVMKLPRLQSRKSPCPDHQEGLAASPDWRATDTQCSYPNFKSVSWISAY